MFAFEYSTLELPLDHRGRTTTTRTGLPKNICFYILRDSRGTVLSVGEAQRGARRIVSGFREPLRRGNKTNHYVYKWRGQFQRQNIFAHIFAFSSLNQLKNQAFRRAVEAEIVYSIRLRFGYWPTKQHEIHFSERHRNLRLVSQIVDLVNAKL